MSSLKILAVLAALSGTAISAASAQSLVPPDVTIGAASTTVTGGEFTQLNWNVTGASSCTAAGAWSGPLPMTGSRQIGPLTKTSEYALQCTGAGGAATQSVSVTVATPAPVVKLSANPSTISSGSAAMLTWSATDAKSCTAAPTWPDTLAASGSRSTGELKTDQTFTLTCTGAGGSTSQSATVSVTAAPPTVSLSASPSTVTKGATSALSWSSANASSCTASGAWSGNKALIGSQITVPLNADQTFMLTCTGDGGSAKQSETVTVGAATAPVVHLQANPSTLQPGQSATLQWSALNATACTASGPWSGGKAISGSQSTGAVTANATYTLSCSGVGGSAAQSTTVSVTGPAPTVSLTARQSSISKSASTTLNWSSTNASSCAASGAWSGGKALQGAQSTGELIANATYVLTCEGPGGSAAQSATISVTAPAPTINLIAHPSTIERGASSTLIWWGANATGCTASDGWSGSQKVYGQQSTGRLSTTTTYTLTCSGIGGPAVQTATVTVGSPLGASVKLSAEPSTLKSGASSMLTWSSANATLCTASGAWSGTKPSSGSQSTGELKANETYALTCSGAGGNASQSATVSVTDAPPTVALSASPNVVNSGANSMLSWTSTRATACAASGGWSGNKSSSGSQSTGALKANETYTLTCSGSGGSTSQSVSITVKTSAPTITLSANPSTVKSGAGSTLNWSAASASSCSAGGDWSGVRSVSGSQSTGVLSANSTYTLTCVGAGGSSVQSATVSVTAPAPTVSLSVGPSAIASGGSSTLTWSSINATACSAGGGWSGAKAVRGTQSTGTLSANSTFTLTCSGSGGSASQSATVAVKSLAPVVTLTASPSTVANGKGATLNWSATNAATCAASGAWSGTKPASGSQATGALTATKTYSLACSGSGGSTTQSTTVSVTAPAPAVTLSANPSTLKNGAASTLSWSATNATSCTASGGWNGAEATSGSRSTSTLTSTANFTLTCHGAGGTASQSATVTVSSAQPSVLLSASPPTISSGGSSTLSWSSTDANSCSATGAWSGSRTTSGSLSTGALSASKSYALSCSGPGGTTIQTASVTVTPATRTGTVTLSWLAPTTNTNGSPVTQLSGYTIYYGNSPSALTQSVVVKGASSTSYEISGLASGTWYFAVAANAADGVESAISNVSSDTI